MREQMPSGPVRSRADPVELSVAQRRANRAAGARRLVLAGAAIPLVWLLNWWIIRQMFDDCDVADGDTTCAWLGGFYWMGVVYPITAILIVVAVSGLWRFFRNL